MTINPDSGMIPPTLDVGFSFAATNRSFRQLVQFRVEPASKFSWAFRGSLIGIVGSVKIEFYNMRSSIKPNAFGTLTSHQLV